MSDQHAHTTAGTARAVWALGDYHRVGQLLAEFGHDLVRACSISTGQRVLDVGAGTGNVAITAAATGATVVASDLSAELFDAGRRAAARRGVRVEWVEADAERLPFGDGEFDVVTSAVGAVFAPDHQAVADELVRVCRPGGLIGMINWPPHGFAADFFAVFAPYAPPAPPDARSPLLWGTADYVRALFGSRVSSLEVSEQALSVDHFAEPGQLCAFYKQYFGPTIATYAGLGDALGRVAALDREFLEFANRANRAGPGEPARYEYPYLRVVARVSNGQRSSP